MAPGKSTRIWLSFASFNHRRSFLQFSKIIDTNTIQKRAKSLSTFSEPVKKVPDHSASNPLSWFPESATCKQCSALRISSERGRHKTAAMIAQLLIVIFFTPRSTSPINVLWNPDFSASSSWVYPILNLSARILLPRARKRCLVIQGGNRVGKSEEHASFFYSIILQFLRKPNNSQ